MIAIINKVLSNNNLPIINQLDESLSLTNDLGLDSIMLAELTVRLEDEYNIDVFENGMVYTIGDLMKKINP